MNETTNGDRGSQIPQLRSCPLAGTDRSAKANSISLDLTVKYDESTISVGFNCQTVLNYVRVSTHSGFVTLGYSILVCTKDMCIATCELPNQESVLAWQKYH